MFLQAILWLIVVIAFLLGMRGIALATGIATVPELEEWEILVESAATLPAFWLGGWLLDRRRFKDFGFRLSRDWAIDFVFGLFLGAFLICLIVVVMWAAGWVTVTGTFVTSSPDRSFAVVIALWVVTFLLVSTQEELMCRGYILTNLAEGLNFARVGPRGAVVVAALLSAGIFGALHMLNPHSTAVSTLSVCLGGIILALGYVLTGELAIPIGLHATWNFFQANVFGFPVSGSDLSPVTFLAVQRHGPALWTGDEFGPESGLLACAAVILGCALIVGWVRLRYGRVRLFTAIALPPSRPASSAPGGSSARG